MTTTLTGTDPNWSLSVAISTAQELTDANVILNEFQVGIESDTRLFKIGDGLTAWVDLIYAPAIPARSTWLDLAPSDNLLDVTEFTDGLRLSKESVNFLTEAQNAWTGLVTDQTTYGTDLQRYTASYLGIISRQLITLGLGSDYLPLITQASTPLTVTARLLSVESALSNVNALVLQLIDDTAPSTTASYSSSKVEARITELFTALVGGAPSALDTVKELATVLGNDPTYLTRLASELAGAVEFIAQSFTAAQTLMARSNIGTVSASEFGAMSDIGNWNDVLTGTVVSTAVNNSLFAGSVFQSVQNFKNYVISVLAANPSGIAPVLWSPLAPAAVAAPAALQLIEIPMGEQDTSIAPVLAAGSYGNFSMQSPFQVSFVQATLDTPEASADTTVTVNVNGVALCSPVIPAGAASSYGNPVINNVANTTLDLLDVVNVTVPATGTTAKALKIYLSGRKLTPDPSKAAIYDFLSSNPTAIWYSASDLSRMWQDSARTTPVTALGQPVGYIKSQVNAGAYGPAVQSTAASRPTLTNRLNLLVNTEKFNTADWVIQTGVTVTDNAAAAPNGTQSAALVSWSGADVGTGIYQWNIPVSSNIVTRSIYVRSDTPGGTVEIVDPVRTGGVVSVTLTTSWQRITLTELQTSACGIWLRKTASSPATLYIASPQVEFGFVANAYQRVVSSNNYQLLPPFIQSIENHKFVIALPPGLSSSVVTFVWVPPGGTAQTANYGTGTTYNLSYLFSELLILPYPAPQSTIDTLTLYLNKVGAPLSA